MNPSIKEMWDMLPRRLQGFSLSLPVIIYSSLLFYLAELALPFSANTVFWFTLLNGLIFYIVALNFVEWVLED